MTHDSDMLQTMARVSPVLPETQSAFSDGEEEPHGLPEGAGEMYGDSCRQPLQQARSSGG